MSHGWRLASQRAQTCSNRLIPRSTTFPHCLHCLFPSRNTRCGSILHSALQCILNLHEGHRVGHPPSWTAASRCLSRFRRPLQKKSDPPARMQIRAIPHKRKADGCKLPQGDITTGHQPPRIRRRPSALWPAAPLLVLPSQASFPNRFLFLFFLYFLSCSIFFVSHNLQAILIQRHQLIQLRRCQKNNTASRPLLTDTRTGSLCCDTPYRTCLGAGLLFLIQNHPKTEIMNSQALSEYVFPVSVKNALIPVSDIHAHLPNRALKLKQNYTDKEDVIA